MTYIDRFRRLHFFTFFVPTLESELARQLADCSTILDLGCGPSSPLSRVSQHAYRVGVEPFGPYLRAAELSNTHHRFYSCLIGDLDLPEKSFDAVVLIDVIEHMDAENALNALYLAEKWAVKKVIVSSPNGFIAQKSLDGNVLQEHRSGWTVDQMNALGFHCVGLAGPKWLRQEVESETMGDDILTTIKYRPKLLWFLLASVLQPLTYRFPHLSFSVLSTKNVSRRDS